MQRDKTCVIIGHRECYGVNANVLEEEIVKLINLGVEEFLCGGMGEFDRLCAGTIDKLRTKYSHIRCVLVIPYLTSNLTRQGQLYDCIEFPEYKSRDYRARIAERNRHMVDKSAYAICYVTHAWGGAAKTLKYAKKRSLRIAYIHEN